MAKFKFKPDLKDIALELLGKYNSNERACIGEWSHQDEKDYAELKAEVAEYKARIEDAT